ncbi:MAG: hypothetical protein O3B31_07780 [Chloroflexi bacterium]|nr:hypothetical protein [Chloroflexota bacterium]
MPSIPRSNRHAPLDALAELGAAERLEIAAAARAAVRAVAVRLVVGGALDLTALAAEVEVSAIDVYVDGRPAGLCHDGALELFRDAADGDGDAVRVCEARLRPPA